MEGGTMRIIIISQMKSRMGRIWMGNRERKERERVGLVGWEGGQKKP
jgi:hypothetical protein